MTRIVCLAGLLLLLALPVLAQGAATAGPVPRFGKFEAAFRLPEATGSPFDPALNDVQGMFQPPSGPSIAVPAFWDGDGLWKVRFAPAQVGAYRFSVLRNRLPVHPTDLTADHFTCVPSPAPGFVRRDPAHVQRFVFDSGAPYYPFGCNQAWGSNDLPGYPEMFAKMGAQRMNWARVWMTFWDGKALEWSPDRAKNPKPGDLLLDAARRWDTIFDAAAQNGIYIQMTLQHHGQYTAQTDPNWRDNPFNVANGGFLQNPQDFFTDPRARALTKAKYRYIIARWGYSDHLLAWELFNEVQNIGEARTHFETVIAWHNEMAAFLRQTDPYHHLVTTSNSPPGDPLELGVPLDYDQVHSYVPDIISLFAALDTSKLTRPVFWGEWGRGGSDAQTEAFLHDGLWSGILTTAAGGPQFWYWDDIQKKNWWPEYGSVGGYLAASHVTEVLDLKRVTPTVETSEKGDISFAPSLAWEATRTFALTVSPETGAATGLDGVSSFLQGSYHRDMSARPVVFHVHYAGPGQFILTLGDIAKAGAHPQVTLDGQPAAEKDYPAAAGDRTSTGETLTVAVPAGQHEIGLFNTGNDWVTINKITLTQYAPGVAAVAKGSHQAVFFWAYARDRAGAVSGTLRFAGLTPGSYAVTLWDTARGIPLGPVQAARVTNGILPVSLPPVIGDVAGWARKK